MDNRCVSSRIVVSADNLYVTIKYTGMIYDSGLLHEVEEGPKPESLQLF